MRTFSAFALSSPPPLLPRYFKQDSAAEIAARDKLVRGYLKLKLDNTTGVPLDDEESADSPGGDISLEKVKAAPTRVISRQ